jgi:hypothetical protein
MPPLVAASESSGHRAAHVTSARRASPSTTACSSEGRAPLPRSAPSLPDAGHAVQRVYALDVFEEMLTRSVQDLLVGGHVAGTMSNVGLMSLAHRVPLGLP